ncbi:MAG: hypothetical protein IKF68_06400 [Erysipelotrichaceae bacterium]|nr:hypothetical protein [Erysipelotrichaceae bacterium]
MKYFFNAKVIRRYCIIYTLLTLTVNIFCIYRGYDYTGIWHDIDRAIVLFIVMLGTLLVIHISFRKKLIDQLGYFLPLFVSLLAYAFLLYIRGVIARSLFIKLLAAALILYIATAVLGSVWTSLRNTSRSMLSSKTLKNLRFDVRGFLLLLLILLPMVIWHLVKGEGNVLALMISTKVYIAAIVIFVIMAVSLILTISKDDHISVPVWVLIVVYYVLFILCFSGVVNVFTVEMLQISAAAALMVYESENRRIISLVLSIVILIMIFYACLSYFGY